MALDSKREITTSEKGIVELVRMLEGKKLLIPPFQREFVWEPEDVLTLWDSLYRFYPIGSLLCWESPAYLRVHRGRYSNASTSRGRT